MSVFLAGLSALCYGAADYAGGRATAASPVFSVLLLSQAVGLLAVLLMAPFVPGASPQLTDLFWGAAAGASGVVGLALLYRALATAPAAVASPTAALIGAAAPVIAGTLLGEQPSVAAWVGIGLAIPAVLLLTVGHRAHTGAARALALGVAAGLGFGGFFICISRTTADSGMWPLVSSKVAAIFVAGIVAMASGAEGSIRRGSRVAAIAAGVLDMGANVFFLIASRIGLLAISSVVSSLYPAPTVVLARVFDGQKLSGVRIAGLVLALAGVGLMTL